eukprot:1863312-Ditylum_brightwellii.AAC.1
MSTVVMYLFDAYAEECGGEKAHAPLHVVVEKVVLLVDIINARAEKGYKQISSPTHCHLEELVLLIHTFSEWCNKVKGDEDETFQMTQDRHGSD